MLTLLGVGTLFYALVTVTEFFVGGHLAELLEERRTRKMIDSLTDHYLICGFGRVGRQVARDLRAAGAKYVVVDNNPENRDLAQGIGVRFIEGEPSEDEMLRSAGIDKARGVIACVDSDAENIFITLTARQMRPDINIVARAAVEDSEGKLRRAGADRVISPYKASGAEMARLALHPQVSGMLDVAPEYRMEEIEVSAGCEGAGHEDRRRARRRDHRRAAPARRHVRRPARLGDRAARRRRARRHGHRPHHGPPRGALRAAGRGARIVNPVAELRAAVEAAAGALREDGAVPGTAPTLERPPKPEFGDYSTNAAMLLAPMLGQPPREIAQRLGEELAAKLPGRLERFEVAGPGFVNLFLADDWHRAALEHVIEAGDAFGAGGATAPEKVLVEFVSANPTGPPHAGHARNAAYGDSLGRVLSLHGHAVTREYYVNDFGSQVVRFGESIQARARGEEVPEDGYQGDYIQELAAEIPDAATGDVREIARAGVEIMLARARESLHAFGVDFDAWFSEASLHDGEPSGVDRAFAQLEAHGHTYRSEGALWLRTTAFGDDKDRVLERSSGEHTYFASDIAYHEEKRGRGFDRLINVWGADHHGHVRRMKIVYEALGGDPDQLELVIMQFVHLVEHGERSSMSKRAGEFVTLDELRRPDRRRRRALVPAPALARHDDRARRRPGARGVQREPRLLRAVRPRADRLDARQGGGGARRGGARARSATAVGSCTRPSAR